MKIILAIIIFAATTVAVTSAPTSTNSQEPLNSVGTNEELTKKLQDFYRDKRSQYQYVSPCAAAAAAASSPVPAIAPAAYPVNLASYHDHPRYNYYGMPHYRSVDFEPEELLNFSDMDHMMSEHLPMARYAYTIPAASHTPTYAAPAAPAVKPGPAIGVFPEANVAGCSVPILVSCVPSIVQGHMVQSQPHYQYAGDSYRGVEAMAHHSSEEGLQEAPTVHEHLNPVHDGHHAIVHQ